MSVRQLKVLFVIDGLGTGGAERSLAELLPGLAEADIHAIIACLHRRSEGMESSVLARGADVRFLSGGPASILGLRRIIAQDRPDLIHTTILAASVVGRLASIGSPATVLTSLVNTSYEPIRLQDPRVRPLAMQAVRTLDTLTARTLCDHFHAITDAVKRSAVETMGLDPARITVVYRGRDPVRLGEPSRRRRGAARQALGLRADDEVIVNVGRQEFQKGQRFLLQTVASMLDRRPHLKVLLAGRRGASSSELDRLLEEPRLRDRVHMLGHRDDVPDVLAAADVFAFPSLYEGLGGALIEAMALGLPIVASDLPAVREVVDAEENAILVAPGSTEELARGLELVLDDAVRSEAFGRRSREIFLERFTLDRSTKAMIALYERLVPLPASAVVTDS
jgi:glycosyltransferase involved in cell wall biosynthesis